MLGRLVYGGKVVTYGWFFFALGGIIGCGWRLYSCVFVMILPHGAKALHQTHSVLLYTI